jgi:hypothetical protein
MYKDEINTLLDEYCKEVEPELTKEDLLSRFQWLPIGSPRSIWGLIGYQTWKHIAIIYILYIKPAYRGQLRQLLLQIGAYFKNKLYTEMELHLSPKFSNVLSRMITTKPYYVIHKVNLEEALHELLHGRRNDT